MARGETSGRSDDNEEVITKRIKEYHAKTAIVASHYDAQGKLVNIKGEGSVDDIFKSLSAQIDKYLQPA